MAIQIFNDIEQGTEEWFSVRAQIPTASMFSAVIAKGRGGAPSKTRLTYMYKIAGQIISGQMTENFSTSAMERGHVMEEEARRMYEFDSGNDVNEVGFIRNGDVGCSPDGLVGDEGMIEIKSKAPHILISALLDDEMPAEHEAQVQGQMLVADRKWCDFIAYYTGMPMMVKRIYRDDEYSNKLSIELDKFNQELNELVNKIKEM